MKKLMENTGIYLVYPISEKIESIFKQKNYKTKVNNEHTKVGITEKSFKSRKKCYVDNFDDVDFMVLAIVDAKYLKIIEKEILIVIKREFNIVGYSREWIDSNNRSRIIEIIYNKLEKSGIPYVIPS